MEEEIDNIDKNYKLGFNHGYYLSQDGGKYLPEVIDGIKNKELTYYKGLLAGKKQFERENFLNQLKEKNISKSEGKDFEKE